MALVLQHRLDERGGGGLAVGTGDADHLQARGRMAKPVGADLRPGHTGVRRHQLGVQTHILLHQHGGGACLLCGLGEAVAVYGSALNAHEQTALLHTTGVAGDGHDLGVLFQQAEGNAGVG